MAPTTRLVAIFLATATPLLAQDPLGRPATRQDTTQEADYTWSVNESLGPSKLIRYEVSEGTWMNLDLSPDGQTIVFDLLGDLYTMPASGGRATRITHGAAFDFHPRFSPDGRRIAFISDRDGAQNIWLIDPDGSAPTQVSNETNREVNSPAWSPDGEYLFARKHFVETRSLGAGEVWMYHRSGGGGLQVTERTSWQKDQGEPAVSPDGRYLYYSEDVTPGEFFEYNKDPYAGIYAILRRDLVTGETERVTGGPGGAVAPRVSPDGRLLAFVRRDRLDTELWIRNLATGQEWALWDGLERDMQEIWAIHGVYATYDWTPEGDAIVVWAQGGFWRIPVGTHAPAARGPAAGTPLATATRIPFTATVEQRIHEGLRYRVDVAPDTWRARMLRNVTTSPDGRVVAYDALGKIWIVEGDRQPRRLTNSGDDVFELAPAFSPDGRRIAYATWSDEAGGRIRVVGVNGRGGRDVVAERGHYTDPSWSPDGERIVYRKVGGDDIRGEAFGEREGVYIVSDDGGTPTLVRENGAEPSFDHTGERIYVRLGGGRLASTDLTGGDEIVHLNGENVTDIAVSPDGEWVAFAERYHAYVARFPKTGRTITLSGTTNAYPVAKVSDEAGMYLHWSRGGAGAGEDAWAVHWTLGPEYFTTTLADEFDFLAAGGPAGEPAEDDDAPPVGRDISFTVTTPTPEGITVLTGARIITMAGQGWTPPGGWEPESRSYQPFTDPEGPGGTPAVIENGTIVVEGDRITAIGQTGAITVPAGARHIDVSGHTIIPGLIDVHAHVGGENDGILAQTSWPLLANLAYGVTTSHDPSNDTETVFSNIELLRAGAKLGPRLFSTGTILYGAETPFKAVVMNYEDAVAHLRRMKAVGAVSVKSYNQRMRSSRQWIVKAARELEMMVVPEGGALYFNNVSMILDGHTGVEHSIPVPEVYEDIERLWGASSTGYTPTIIVGYGGLWGENWFYQHYDVWENERLLQYTPRRDLDARSRRRVMAAGADDFNHIEVAQATKELADAGTLVHLGAHGQLQGLGAHWELWMFEQGGMTPMQALAAGTIKGAQYLGMDRDIGSLEPGKLADLVVLTANPLDDITHSDDIAMVMLGGRLYDADDLQQIAPVERQAPVMPWER